MNHSPQDVRKGLWLGLLGVAIFAVTLPMTRLATGTVDAPQMSPWFVTFGRATLAGGLSIIFLLLTRSRWPAGHERLPLAMATLGNAIGFPLLLGFALRQVTSGHAAVVLALLPLATAAMSVMVPVTSGCTAGSMSSRISCQPGWLKPAVVRSLRLGPQPTWRRDFMLPC